MKNRRRFGPGSFGIFAAAALIGVSPAAFAQEDPSGPRGPFQPWVGEMGITETVAQIMARDLQTAPTRFITEADEATWPNRAKLPQNPGALFVPQWPWNASGHNAPTIIDRVWNPLTGGGAADNPQTLGLNVNASTLADSGFIPPDSMGAVGPTQVLVCVNGRIRVYDKVTGALGGLNTTTNTFFTSVRNGSTTSDPQVRFDRLSNKWYVLMINTSTPNRFLLAVSGGPTITSTASFTFFFFQQDTVAPAGNAAQLADYPSLGIDANALYTGANMFTSGFQGSSLWVIQKASVQGAGPIVVTAIRNVTLASGTGMFAPRGIDNPDPAATIGYYIGVDHGSLGSLIMRRVTNPGGAPSISANISVTGVPATAAPIANPPASGSSPGPDALDDRLFAAQLHRDRTTGQDFLWSAHNIQVNSLGVASASGGRDACRWYQIQNVATTPSVVQAGTLFDSAASGPISYWTCSAMATGQGHMALGCSNAAATSFISCSTAGRLRTDPLGSIQSPTTIAAGAGPYQVLGGGRQRWGDYAFTSVDPNDDQTMWTVTEFANATNSYAVRMTKLIAPSPVTPAACSPSTLTQGDTAVDVVVSGVSVNGSAFYDTDATYSNRLVATVSGTGVTVNSISFSHASTDQFTMNVTIDAAAAIGARTVTVTNPDGQTVTSAAGILTINPSGTLCYPNCDGSSTDPILNANDFQCFLNAFAASDPYANCDGSTVEPILNANDFQCFLNQFAAGCP